MRVAVTGATGFVGRHAVSALKARGAEVIVLSRDPGRAEHLLETEARPFDLAAAELPSFDAIGCPDSLLHLAWEGLPNYRSLHHFETELPRQFRTLARLLRDGLPALVGVGTCFEYGMASGPLSETTDARPDNPYGFAKETLRRELEFLRAEIGFAFAWARLFYMYGPGQSPKSLLPQLQAAVAEGRHRFDMSGGEQLRDFLPVEDVAQSLAALALKRADCGPVNICSGRPISIRTLVEGWIAENGWTIGLNLGHYPYPDWEPMAFWGDRRRLDGILVEETKTAAPSGKLSAPHKEADH